MPRIYHLSKPAFEQGSYGIKVTFKDLYKTVIPSANIKTLYWWLTDFGGVVINNRSEQVVSSIENPYTVVLNGADLQILDKSLGSEKRVVTLKGTYDSDLGTNLSITYAVSFDLINLLVIAADLYISTVDNVFVGEFVYV